MSSQYSTLYYQLLKKISTSWQELPDKPDESPEKTLHALLSFPRKKGQQED